MDALRLRARAARVRPPGVPAAAEPLPAAGPGAGPTEPHVRARPALCRVEDRRRSHRGGSAAGRLAGRRRLRVHRGIGPGLPGLRSRRVDRGQYLLCVETRRDGRGRDHAVRPSDLGPRREGDGAGAALARRRQARLGLQHLSRRLSARRRVARPQAGRPGAGVPRDGAREHRAAARIGARRAQTVGDR